MVEGLKLFIDGLSESMNHIQAALKSTFDDAQVQELMQKAMQQAQLAQIEAAKNLIPLPTIHKQAMQRGISTAVAAWDRKMMAHSCGQAYVTETDGQAAKYYDVETDERVLCISCGLPYDESGNIRFYQFMVNCPHCGCSYQVTEYRGERSFRENGSRVFWCSACHMLFDRETTPAMFLTQYTKDYVDPQMSKMMFQARTDAWKRDMSEACDVERDEIYKMGTMTINEGKTHTSIHIHQEADTLKEKWDTKVAASNLVVSTDDGEFEWDTWQPPLSTTYTPEELMKKLEEIGDGAHQPQNSYLKNNSTGSTIKDADLAQVLSQEHNQAQHILNGLSQGYVSYDNAVRQLYMASEEARRQGRPECIESEALKAARMLETMQGRVRL